MPSSEDQQHSLHHELISTPLPLFPSNLHKSFLSISPDRIFLSTTTVITLAWNIHDSVTSSSDIIGIFLPGSDRRARAKNSVCITPLSPFLLDKLALDDLIENIYTNSNSLKIGQYQWHCTETLVDKLLSRKCLDAITEFSSTSPAMLLDDTVRFQYYSSITGEVKAQSSLISISHDNNQTSIIENMPRPISIKIYGTLSLSSTRLSIFHSFRLARHQSATWSIL